LGAKELQHLSPVEKRVLKDKVVTSAELGESTRVYIECLDANKLGHQVVDDDLGPSGILVDFEVTANVKSSDEDASMDAKARTCLGEVSAVEAVWMLQNQPSQSDIEKAQNDFVACMRRAGVSLSPNATMADAGAAARQLISGGHVDASTPRGRQLAAVSECLTTITRSTQLALPGLDQALKSLDTSGW
jgi:hypothetical protein